MIEAETIRAVAAAVDGDRVLGRLDELAAIGADAHGGTTRIAFGGPAVWAAAGRPDAVFEIAPRRLRELSKAVIADLKASGEPAPPAGLRPTSPRGGDG